MSKTAGILIVGNEILSGKTVDANSAFLCRELRRLGVDVREISVIPDEAGRISESVRDFSNRFDFVFTSGGIGPTHDDVTIEGIAGAFGKKVVKHPVLVEILKGWYKNEVNESRLKMAEVPEGSDLQAADKLSFPLVVCKNIFIFPGVPEILRSKFEAVREDFRDAPFFLRVIFVKIPEGILAPYMNDLLFRFPKILMGSYPEMSNADYQVKVTLESKDFAYLDEAFRRFLAALPQGAIHKVESETVETR